MNVSMLLFAAVELVSPITNQTVVLLPERQRGVLALETLEARETFLADFRAKTKHSRQGEGWRVSNAVVLRWRATAGEKGPWEIMLSKNADLSDARVFIHSTKKADEATGRTAGEESAAREQAYTLPYANLEIATRYYWRVMSSVTCGTFGHGRSCTCKDRPTSQASAIASFVTEDLAPRWIEIEGRVGNFRDLGGRIGLGGRRVRQGLVFRSQGLNGNSPDGEMRGRYRLTLEDVELLVGEWGIKTELDLRSAGEVAGMNGVSPLGKGVRYVNNPSTSYCWIFTKDGRTRMARNFRVFLDEKNYPILFHCIGGADRTGALAYVLNGVLGVSRREIETDWESTFYPRIPNRDAKGGLVWNSEQYFNEGFAKYGGANASWSERIVLYLKDCGIADEEIGRFRAIMLEEK